MPAEPRVDPARPTDAAGLSARLRRELGPEVVFDRASRPGARLAVCVVPGSRVDTRAFGRWARQARLPAVVVEVDGETVYAGPLSEPGRPGCAECARVRRVAAAAGMSGAAAVDPELTTRTAPVSPGWSADGEATSRVTGGQSPRPGGARTTADRTVGDSEATSRVTGGQSARPGGARTAGSDGEAISRVSGGQPVRPGGVRTTAEWSGGEATSRVTGGQSARPGGARTTAEWPVGDGEATSRVTGGQLARLDGARTTGRALDDGEVTTRVTGHALARLAQAPDGEATTRVSGAVIAGVDDRTAVVAGSVVAAADAPRDAAVVALLRERLELRDHVAEIRDGTTLWHRVIPLPDCPVCGGADGIATVKLPDTDDPAELLESLAGWVDPLTGVIPWLSVRQPLPGGIHVATAAPPHHLDQAGRAHPLPIGWGKGMDEAAAIRSAVGEAVERYAASLPDPARLHWARPADLDGDVLDPRELPLYDPAQYAAEGFDFVPFDRRVDHPWVRGTWLHDGRPVWVPAVLAYLQLSLLPEHLICQGTSNGLAAGQDAESAAVPAVLELVERDAMLAAWLTGAKGRFLDLDDTLDADLADAVDALTDEGHIVEVHLLPTSTYGATAVALALGDGKKLPGAVLGLGADRDPRAAIRAAIMELAQSAPHLTMLLREKAHPVPERPEDVRGMLDHAAYYFRPDRVVAFDRLRCGGTTRLADLPETGAPASTDDLAGVLGATGIKVALVDVTSSDVATGPFRVVRAVSARLQPLSYGHGNDRAVVPRLRPRLLPDHRRPVHPVW
ncbi:YcaO-like family protein [Actinokineospora sp. 24-640]